MVLGTGRAIPNPNRNSWAYPSLVPIPAPASTIFPYPPPDRVNRYLRIRIKYPRLQHNNFSNTVIRNNISKRQHIVIQFWFTNWRWPMGEDYKEKLKICARAHMMKWIMCGRDTHMICLMQNSRGECYWMYDNTGWAFVGKCCFLYLV